MLQFFLNKNISKKIKLRIKNIIIDKTLTYASETSTLTKRDRKQLNIFKRKVQWNLDLSFPQRSFSRMYCSPFLVPNEVPYK